MNYKYRLDIMIVENDVDSKLEYFVGKRVFNTMQEIREFIDTMNEIEQNNDNIFEYRIIIIEN